MSIATPKGIHYAKLRNGVQKQSKPISEDQKIPQVQQQEPQQPNIFSQLHKDLNQDNLSYINSLLKGRSSSQQNPPSQEKKPLDLSEDNTRLSSNNTSQQTQINFVVKENPQEKLFDQFFKQNNSTERESEVLILSEVQIQPDASSFIEFIEQQINYHSTPSQIQITKKDPNFQRSDSSEMTQENKSLKKQVEQLSNKLQQFNSQKKGLVAEYSQYKIRHDEERQLFKLLTQENKQQKYDLQAQEAEIKHLKKQKITNNKKCDILQQLLVRERIERENNLMTLNKYYAHNYNKDFNPKKMQEIMQNIHAFKPQINQETVSSLADEKFESNDQSLKSSLSHGSLDRDPYEKKPTEQLQKRMLNQVNTKDQSRVMMLQNYDQQKRKQQNFYNKYDETSNDESSEINS